MVGSFGVGELTPGVESAAGVAGWVGMAFAVVGAVGARGGGVVAAAGPVRTGCACGVEVDVGVVFAAVEVVVIDGSGCLGR